MLGNRFFQCTFRGMCEYMPHLVPYDIDYKLYRKGADEAALTV